MILRPSSSQSRDQLLDPGVVGEDLGRAGELAAEQALQHRIEEQHRVRAERSVGPAGLEEMDRRPGQAAELDLAGDLLDELVALLLGRARTGSSRDAAARRAAPIGAPDVAASAVSNAWYAAAPRIAKITCWIVGDWASSSRTAFDRHERGLVEREPADARPEGRERDARHADLAGPGERAPNGRVDDRAARPAVAIERDGVDHDLGGQRAGRA